MAIFQALVLLLFVASFLLVGSRRLGLPYPTLLCLAGVGVALLPHAPSVEIEPHLALALFIAPALLDAAFDTAPRELKPLWPILLALAVGAVVVTTAAVALVGTMMAGLPLFAAVALGAIVAPPDGAAASAVLSQVDFPRRTSLVLQAEGLFNDATALLIFGAATATVTTGISEGGPVSLAFAAPGGIVLGLALGWLYIKAWPLFESTLSGVVVEFTATFGVWLIAERLRLSPVLAVASYAMLIAQRLPVMISARDRVQSYAVWAAAVFVLNVLAFLLMGLQARAIFADLAPHELVRAGWFALAVLLVVVVVRIASMLLYRAVAGYAFVLLGRPDWLPTPGPWRVSVLMSWCGMRGLLTLATAFALPAQFPGRNTIVLAAFAVVLGTLVVQGATLKPLMRLLRIGGDETLADEVSRARKTILRAGMVAAQGEAPVVAELLGRNLEAAHDVARSGEDPQGATHFDEGMARSVAAQRDALHRMRRSGEIADDVFHRLEEELDWIELAARPNREIEIGQI